MVFSVEEIKKNVLADLAKQASVLQVPTTSQDFKDLSNALGGELDALHKMVQERLIDPSVELLCQKGQVAKAQALNRRIKIGLFPVAADPFHWAHLLTALEVQKQLALDKVVFIIQGADARKPHMLDRHTRHLMAIDTLELFSPLFAYSDIGTLLGANDENDLSVRTSNGEQIGEVNFFHDLNRNRHLDIDAYYLVGSDHFNWEVEHNGVRESDTLKRLSENQKKPNLKLCDRHNLAVAFISRNPDEISDKKLRILTQKFKDPVHVVVPQFSFSSTEIRSDFAEGDFKNKNLIMLPNRTYRRILELGLYKVMGV